MERREQEEGKMQYKVTQKKINELMLRDIVVSISKCVSVVYFLQVQSDGNTSAGTFASVLKVKFRNFGHHPYYSTVLQSTWHFVSFISCLVFPVVLIL